MLSSRCVSSSDIIAKCNPACVSCNLPVLCCILWRCWINTCYIPLRLADSVAKALLSVPFVFIQASPAHRIHSCACSAGDCADSSHSCHSEEPHIRALAPHRRCSQQLNTGFCRSMDRTQNTTIPDSLSFAHSCVWTLLLIKLSYSNFDRNFNLSQRNNNHMEQTKQRTKHATTGFNRKRRQ